MEPRRTRLRYYPELREKRYVAAGESYAGVLVPTLAAKILAKRNATNRHAAPYSLEGVPLCVLIFMSRGAAAAADMDPPRSRGR